MAIDGRGGARPGAGGKLGIRGSTAESRFAAAKARKEEALADLRELERDQLRGSLVPRDQDISTWQGPLGVFRQRILSVPTKAAALCFTAGTVQGIEHVLRRLLAESLDELSRSDGLPGTVAGSGETTTGPDGKPVGGPEQDVKSRGSAEPGMWLTSRAEYQRGIMDAVADPSVRQIVVMTSAQVGKSEILLNIVGYHIDQDPAPILLMQPTVERAEAFSKDRLAPMLRDTPCLRGKVADPRSRDSAVEHIGPNIPCTGALLRTEVVAGLEGKFSLAYNISAAFIDGKVDYGTFTNERAAKGDLQNFMKRVKLVRNNDVVLRRAHIADGNPEARLRITMKSGTVHDFVMQKATHLTGDAVLDKFRMNTEKILGKEKVGTAIELVHRLEKVKDVAQLIDAVTV